MKLSARDIGARKQGPKITMLTCYDYPTALLEDKCGIDVQLVGDSVGTNLLGYSDVSQVTVEDMRHHVGAVSRGAKRSFVLCDMPYRSFETEEMAYKNASIFIEAGADGIKMEGEDSIIDTVRYVASRGIPVCSHIGYTPQTDGVKATVQGKDFKRAVELITVAKKMEKAGAFIIVLELIPEQLAREITSILSIPTIGIGAGRYCDGQVQVIFDICGISTRIFRHAKAYDNLSQRYTSLIGSYVSEVKGGIFPAEGNASRLPDNVYNEIVEWINMDKELKIKDDI